MPFLGNASESLPDISVSFLGNASESLPDISVNFSFRTPQPINLNIATMHRLFAYSINEPLGPINPQYRIRALTIMRSFLDRQIRRERLALESYTQTDVMTSELRNAHFTPVEPGQGEDIFIPESLENVRAIFGKIQDRSGLEYEGWIEKRKGLPFLGENSLVRGIWKNQKTGQFIDLIQLVYMQRIEKRPIGPVGESRYGPVEP